MLRYQSAVNPHFAALGNNLPEVHRLVFRCAQDDGDVGIEGIDQLHAMACRQDHVALGRIDNTAVLDIRRDQVNLPAPGRRNGPLILNGPGNGSRGEVVFPRQKILIADVQRRSKESVHVDPGALAEKHAVGVNEKNPAVGLQQAENPGGVLADDPVQDGA